MSTRDDERRASTGPKGLEVARRRLIRRGPDWYDLPFSLYIPSSASTAIRKKWC